MSTKHLILFNILLFYASLPANAQEATPTGTSLRDHLLTKISDLTLYGLPAEGVEGTPFLNEAFVSGDVYSMRAKFTGVPMRYNIYHDLIEFKQNNQTFVLDPQPFIRKIFLEGQVLVVEKYEFRGREKQGFLLLLDSGNVSLMVKKGVNFQERQEPKALESSATPARFSPAPDVFYYKIGNGEVIKVNSVKKLIESLPDHREQMTEFAKKEKLSAVKEDKLVKLVRHYNSL